MKDTIHEEHISLLKYEATLLGCILCDSRAFDVAVKRVACRHFSVQRHRVIFAAMEILHDKKHSLDIINIYEELGKSGIALSRFYGMECYLFDLAHDTPSETIERVTTIANIVFSEAQKRGER